jgi:hypothetical protein
MRAAALLLSFAIALATPAGAQQQPAAKPGAARGSFETLSKSSSIALRGPAAPDDTPDAAPPPPPLTALQPLLQPLASPVQGDPGRCRLTCASSYYFCLASDAPEDCSPAWSQCRAGCDAPSPVQVISNIPVG